MSLYFKNMEGEGEGDEKPIIGKELWTNIKHGDQILVPDVTISYVLDQMKPKQTGELDS